MDLTFANLYYYNQRIYSFRYSSFNEECWLSKGLFLHYKIQLSEKLYFKSSESKI